MIKPKAVLFDFDGVVVNSFEVHYKAWKNAFFELFQKDLGTFPDNLEGKSPIIISECLCDLVGRKDQSKILYDLKGEKLHSGVTPPKLLPGVREITKVLKEQKTPYGIASNATKQFISNSIQQLEIDFSVFFGVEDYEFPKPNPQPYIMLAKSLGIAEADFDNVIVFEDSVAGATAGIEAGMIAVGIETQHSSEVLKKAGCTYSFPTLLQAQELLMK